MSLNRDQFVVVLAALRERLRGGAYVLGEPLTVIELAREWGVSATPIREALSRLAGEGLIEDRRGRGYFAWRTDVSDLVDLYRAQESVAITGLLGLARCSDARAPREPRRPDASALVIADPHDGVRFWEALLTRVALEAGNRFLLAAQQRLADRLAPARRVEANLALEPVEDLNGLVGLFNGQAWRELSSHLSPFFLRRRVAADSIVDKLRINSKLYFQSI